MPGKGNQGKNVGKPGNPGWQPTDKSKAAGKTPPASGPLPGKPAQTAEPTQAQYEGLTGLFIVVAPFRQSHPVRPLSEVVQKYVDLHGRRDQMVLLLGNAEAMTPLTPFIGRADTQRLQGTQERIRGLLQNIDEEIVVNDMELLHYGLVRRRATGSI